MAARLPCVLRLLVLLLRLRLLLLLRKPLLLLALLQMGPRCGLVVAASDGLLLLLLVVLSSSGLLLLLPLLLLVALVLLVLLLLLLVLQLLLLLCRSLSRCDLDVVASVGHLLVGSSCCVSFSSCCDVSGLLDILCEDVSDRFMGGRQCPEVPWASAAASATYQLLPCVYEVARPAEPVFVRLVAWLHDLVEGAALCLPFLACACACGQFARLTRHVLVAGLRLLVCLLHLLWRLLMRWLLLLMPQLLLLLWDWWLVRGTGDPAGSPAG